jgi:hypothetical protein
MIIKYRMQRPRLLNMNILNINSKITDNEYKDFSGILDKTLYI